MFMLVKRNLRLYFRDRSAVFFSLMSVFVALGIYFLFLADTMISDLEEIEGITYVLDSWFLSGSLAIMSVTITLASYGTMVEDETNNIRKDFLSSPIKRSKLTLAYILSSCIIGIIMSLVVLGIGEAFIVARGGELLSIASFLKVFLIIIVSVVSSSAMMFFLASFLHSNSSYSGASTVIGTLIGFLIGLYMPMGSLPDGVQNFVKFVPTFHSSAMFRQVIMEQPMAEGFENLPSSFFTEFEQMMGITIQIGDLQVEMWMGIAFLVVVAVVFYVLSLLKVSRKKA